MRAARRSPHLRCIVGATTLALSASIPACKTNPKPPAPTPSSTAVGSSAPAQSAASQLRKDVGGNVIATSVSDLRITPLYHATVLLEWNGKAVLADPSADVKYDPSQKADIILFTHAHQDHMSSSTVVGLKKPGATIVAPPDVATQLGAHRIVVLKNGEHIELGGVNIEAVPMYNLVRGPGPGRVFHEKERGNGYVMTFGGKRVYLSGDTECTPEMKKLEKIDLAFVCMSLPYTMTPTEAAECVAAFRPAVVYPYHYRNSNLREFESALAAHKDIEVRIRNWYP